MGRVAALLRDGRIPFAVVGGAAMAVHGIVRSTRDLDLLVLAPRCLESATWAPLCASGVEVQIRTGDVDDPLAGVVRLVALGVQPVDVVVGRHRWQETILARARDVEIEGVRVPVADPTGVILLKLYAGGPQDLWDVTQLLAGPGRAALIAEVEASLNALPAGCRSLWTRALAPESA